MNYLIGSYIGCGFFNAFYTGLSMTMQLSKWYKEEMKNIYDLDSDENKRLSCAYFERHNFIVARMQLTFLTGWFYTAMTMYDVAKSVYDPKHIRTMNDINFLCPYDKQSVIHEE